MISWSSSYEHSAVILLISCRSFLLFHVFTYRDHAGGNKELLKSAGKVPVYGGDERVDALTDKVTQNDQFSVSKMILYDWVINCLKIYDLVRDVV